MYKTKIQLNIWCETVNTLLRMATDSRNPSLATLMAARASTVRAP